MKTRNQKLIDAYARLAWATLITLLMLIVAHSGRAEELAFVYVDNHEYATEVSINNFSPAPVTYRPFPGFGSTATVPANDTSRFAVTVAAAGPRFSVLFLHVPSELVSYTEVRHMDGELIRVPPAPQIAPGGPTFQYLDLHVDGRSEIYLIAPFEDANATVYFHDLDEKGKPRERSFQVTVPKADPLVIPIIAARATIHAGWSGGRYANAPIYTVARTGGETVIPRAMR
jgi:hypothetical protein